MSTPPSCSTTATSSSTVAGSPYQTFCSGAADSNYTISYATGSLTRGQGTADGHRLEHLHHLRRHGGDDHPELLGLRRTGTAILADRAANLLDHGHQLEHGGGIPLSRPRAAARRTRTTPSCT